MEQCEEVVSYSYTVEWKLRDTEHEREDSEYNERVIELPGEEVTPGDINWNRRYLRLCTVADASMLLLRCEAKLGDSGNDDCQVTFLVLDGESEVFKTLTCRAVWSPRYFGSFRGEVACGSPDLLSRCRTRLFAPDDDSIRVLCEVKVASAATRLPGGLRGLLSRPHDPGAPRCDCGLLLRSGRLHDVRLVASDGRELLAHKVILAGHSSVFRSMFELEMRERVESVVRINDVGYETLEALLRFVYTGELSEEAARDLAPELFVVADKYDFGELKFRCERRLASSITVETAIRLCALGDAHDSEYLRSAAESFIVDNAWSVAMTPDFQHLYDAPLLGRLHSLLLRRARDLGLEP